ncbi:MAG: outer membrane lipoprotein-sorting protein [Pseudomonadota bacterium]
MKRFLTQLGVALGVALCLSPNTAGADAAGEQLARKVYDRPNGKDATSVVSMVLQDRGRAPRVRKMLVYRLDRKGGEVASLIRFLEPADIEGTGLLTLDRADGESNQWVYLPAMERVRRIDSGRKGGRFVNSDYFYEDLRDRKVEQDEHRVVGRETVAGVACDILESVPTEAGNSVYAKRLSWIDPATALPMRVDFYGRNEAQPGKRLQVLKREKVQGYWTVMDSVMTDLESGHQTRLTVERALYDRRLPARLFSTQTLEDESAEEDYRP